MRTNNAWVNLNLSLNERKILVYIKNYTSFMTFLRQKFTLKSGSDLPKTIVLLAWLKAF